MAISAIKDILKTLSVMPAMKEHLEIVKSKLEFLEKDYEKVLQENATLKKENETLKNNIKNVSDFKDCSNFLLKSDGAGKYFNQPYCPRCKMPMSDFRDANSYICDKAICGHYAINFDETNTAIKDILKAL